MRMLTIGPGDIEVSRLCFGAGDLGTRAKGAAAEQVLAAYIEGGGTFFDTAHCYGFWAAEGVGAGEVELGRCLRALGFLDRAVIATKGAHPDGGPGYPRPDRYLSPETIASDLDESLRRLGVEHVALLYLHRDDRRVPVGEVIEALNAEIHRGRVRCLGASNWSAERIAEANQYAARNSLQGFAICQVQWSLATPTWTMGPDPTMRYVTRDDAAAYCAMGMPLAAYSATAGGYFSHGTGAFDTEVNRQRRQRALALAQGLGCTATQVALAWLLSQQATVLPIVGALRPAHMKEALAAVEIELTAEQADWLRDG